MRRVRCEAATLLEKEIQRYHQVPPKVEYSLTIYDKPCVRYYGSFASGALRTKREEARALRKL